MSEPIDVESELKKALAGRKEGAQIPLDFPGAELSGVDLVASDLVGANLRGADLSGAVLSGSRLSGVDFRDAVLVGAHFDGADLTEADFRGADLAGARFDDAVLCGTRLEGACFASVLGDPLTLTGAKMDRTTVERSKMTMREIAQLVIRGAEVNETEVAPRSVAPAAFRSVASVASASWSEPPPDEILRLSSMPPSAPLPPGVSYDDLPPADQRLPESRRVSHGPTGRISIIPSMRMAESSARLEIAGLGSNDAAPFSARAFNQLNALIDAARAEDVPPGSLRPDLGRVRTIQSEFAFPTVGSEYLGVRIAEALDTGSNSRCFRGMTADGQAAVVRVFDPNCEGAALQLPAFQRGLRVLNKLQVFRDEDHVEVVELLAVSLDQTAYVVRDYDGKNLSELIDVRLSLEEGLESITSLARTVSAIHAHGVLVRAWKPSNVLVDGFHLVVSEPDMVHLPALAQHLGNVEGYAAYVAPEELNGQGTRSPTADIFSLGKVLEYLLTGHEPLAPLGGVPAISQLDNMPAQLVEIVRRATAKDPKDRYQQVSDLLNDLVAFQENGERAQLRAPLRAAKVSQLAVPTMAAGPNLEKLVAEQRKPPTLVEPEEESLGKRRQLELGVALVGFLSAVAVALMMIFAPKSVDKMESFGVYIVAFMALAVFSIPVAGKNVWLFRGSSYLAAFVVISFLNPLGMASFTWKSRLKSGSAKEKEAAVMNLARLGKVNMRNADLDGINLAERSLPSADFSGASLREVNFRGALLGEANFSGANVAGAEFSEANLYAAKLETSVGLEEATCDRFTRLPPEFSCRRGFLTRQADEPVVELVAQAPRGPDLRRQRLLEKRNPNSRRRGLPPRRSARSQ